LPNQYLALSRSERAFIAACIKTKIENEEQEIKKARRRKRK